MLRAVQDNWPLFLGVLLLMISNGLLVTLLTIRGLAIGFSEPTLGVIQAGYPMGAMIGGVIAPRIVERVGHVRAFGALASLSSVAAIVHLITDDAYSWFAMRALAGFCFPGLYVVSESWLNAKADNHSRASLLSIYFVTQLGGIAIGQAMLGIPDPSGQLLFALASILISISLVPMLVSAAPAPPFVAPERMSMRRLLAISPMGMLGAGLNGVAQASFFVALPFFALSVDVGEGGVGLLLTVGTLAGMAAQFPIGWLSDRMDRRIVAIGSGALAAPLCLALASGAASGGAILYVLVGLLAGLTLPIYSVCIAHANDQLTPSQIVPASGALILAFNVGLLTGSIGAPALTGVVGATAVFWLIGASHVAMVALAGLRMTMTKAPDSAASAAAYAAQATPIAHGLGVGEESDAEDGDDAR